MNRGTSEFCNHALSEFSFLRNAGFSESHAVGIPHFSIEFVGPDSRTVGIGAFLPRYEYYVSLRHADAEYGLDELAAVLEPDREPEHDWTWAHSDPATFMARISYSASLLRRFITHFLDDDGSLWERVSARRNSFANAEWEREQRKTAATAFGDGRWQEAIRIYESLRTLSPVESKRLSIAKRRLK